MKKILAYLASMTLVGAPAVSLVACTNKEEKMFDEFMGRVLNNETFVFSISSKGCPHCRSFEELTAKKLYDKSSESDSYAPSNLYKAYLDQSKVDDVEAPTTNYSLNTWRVNDQEMREKLLNAKFYTTYDLVKSPGDFSKLKWVDKLKEWMVGQERELRRKVNGDKDTSYSWITKDLIKLNSPSFIYVYNGQYRGFSVGTDADIISDNDGVNSYLNNFMSFMTGQSQSNLG